MGGASVHAGALAAASSAASSAAAAAASRTNERRLLRRSSIAAVAAEAIKTAKRATDVARHTTRLAHTIAADPVSLVAAQRRVRAQGMNAIRARKERVDARLQEICGGRTPTTSSAVEWKHRMPRRKSPWDYVLEEVTWMSTDFREERKWKTKMAREAASGARAYVLDAQRRKAACKMAMQTYHKAAAKVLARAVRAYWRDVATKAGLDWKGGSLISRTASGVYDADAGVYRWRQSGCEHAVARVSQGVDSNRRAL